jgi:hypothetical protein
MIPVIVVGRLGLVHDTSIYDEATQISRSDLTGNLPRRLFNNSDMFLRAISLWRGDYARGLQHISGQTCPYSCVGHARSGWHASVWGRGATRSWIAEVGGSGGHRPGAVPRVLTEISCPLPQLLHGVGERVQELVANLHQFSARERIEHLEIGRKGNPHRVRKTNFNYVAQINQAAAGSPSVEEYRTGASPTDYPEPGMVDTGTAAFALIFYRFYIEDFVMSCEGLADVKFRPAWQLHFAQRTRNLFHVYRLCNDYYPVKLKGRAWIAADNYEVLRLETDLLEPVGQIRFAKGTLEYRVRSRRISEPECSALVTPGRRTLYGLSRAPLSTTPHLQ